MADRFLVLPHSVRVRVPARVRTWGQLVRFLAREGYSWALYMLVRHIDRPFFYLVQRYNPDVPWTNVAEALRRANRNRARA